MRSVQPLLLFLHSNVLAELLSFERALGLARRRRQVVDLFIDLFEHRLLLLLVLVVDGVAPGGARVDRHHQLPGSEPDQVALLVDDLEEGLLAERLEELLQIRVRKQAFEDEVLAVESTSGEQRNWYLSKRVARLVQIKKSLA